MGGVGASSLFTDAVLVRLDVYGAAAHCGADGLLASGAGAPLLSRNYAQGQAITLDIAPGPHAIVVSTFADDASTTMLGQACTEADLAAGSEICFDLTLQSVAGLDLAPPMACTLMPDTCGKGSYCDGQFCQVGCSSDSACRTDADGGVSSAPLCDVGTHRCVECMKAADCPGGPQATGTDCVNGKCVVSCTSGFTNCNGAIPDGCECKTSATAPACCPGGCQTEHSNGWGGYYYDCNPLGQPSVTPTTYTSMMANLAAFSDTIHDGTPSGGFGCTGSNGDKTFEVCEKSPTNNTCTCWVYDAVGPTYPLRIGHTYHSSGVGGDKGCYCPVSSDPTWN